MCEGGKHMKGHVYKRGETWTFVVDVGRDPVTGKRKQKSKGGFRKNVMLKQLFGNS
jgi:Arm DNA-binding domain